MNDMSLYDEKREADVEDITKNCESGEISELVVVAEGEEKTTWFVWILVLCSSISGLLFGEWSCRLCENER